MTLAHVLGARGRGPPGRDPARDAPCRRVGRSGFRRSGPGTRRRGGRRPAWRRATAGLLLAPLLLLLGPATGRTDLDVRASKRLDLQSFSVRGDLSQFLHDNPLFLDGNRLEQFTELEAQGNAGDKVSVDLFMDDSGFNDDERRMRIDVTGRVWQLSAGRIPVGLGGSRFLMNPRTGMGLQLTGNDRLHTWELLASRPEGRTQRNSFEGQGALQEYVLKDAAGIPNPLVVVGSERVTLDGVRLERGHDYEVDYLEGAVLLSRDLLPLSERRRLVVEFEEAGQGSGFRSTVLGGRLTRRFGHSEEARARNLVSVAYVAAADDLSEPASVDTTGLTPTRLGVLGATLRADLRRGVSVRAEGALSSLDEDRWSEEGFRGRAGAMDVGLAFSRHNFELEFSRSVVEPGYQGIGIERFQAAGEGREASRDAAVSLVEGLWRAGRSLTLRARFRDALTNLAEAQSEPTERVRAAQVDVEMSHLLGGELGVHYLGEGARVQPAGSREVHDGGRDRVSVIHRRELGAVGLQVRGEVEASRTDPLEDDATTVASGPVPGENQVVVGAELAGPPEKRIGWSVGGSLREVSRRRPWEPVRVVRDVTAGFTSSVGQDLDVGLDLRHHKDHDLAAVEAVEVGEANTGEARLRYLRGSRWEVESSANAEVRSRVLLDPDSAGLDPLRSGRTSTELGTDVPQTAVTENPVLTHGTRHSVLFRPGRKLEVAAGHQLGWERDSLTGEAFRRDRSTDGRVLWEPSERWRASYEVGDGDSFNRPSESERRTWNQRLEVVRALGEASSLEFRRQQERLVEEGALSREEETIRDRVGLERRLRENLMARGGLSHTRELSGGDTAATGVDMALEWTRSGRGQRVELGVELADVTGEDATGAEVDSIRKRWYLSAGSRLGEEGFLDVNMALSAVGADGRGGEGYRSSTTNMSLGVEF